MRWCEKLTHPTNAALVTHDPTWKVSLSERELEKLQSHLFVELWKYNFTRYFLIFEKLLTNSNLNFFGSKLPEMMTTSYKFCASRSIYLYLASHHLDCQKKSTILLILSAYMVATNELLCLKIVGAQISMFFSSNE